MLLLFFIKFERLFLRLSRRGLSGKMERASRVPRRGVNGSRIHKRRSRRTGRSSRDRPKADGCQRSAHRSILFGRLARYRTSPMTSVRKRCCARFLAPPRTLFINPLVWLSPYSAQPAHRVPRFVPRNGAVTVGRRHFIDVDRAAHISRPSRRLPGRYSS